MIYAVCVRCDCYAYSRIVVVILIVSDKLICDNDIFIKTCTTHYV